jgi:hypothetical protein
MQTSGHPPSQKQDTASLLVVPLLHGQLERLDLALCRRQEHQQLPDRGAGV